MEDLEEFAMCIPGCLETVRASLSRRAIPIASNGLRPAADAASASPAKAHAVRTNTGAGPFTSVLDLTHTLSPAFPVFPGDPVIEVTPFATLHDDGYNMKAWHLVEHSGTHLDAPIHFADNGASVEAIDAATLIAPLAAVDITAKVQHSADAVLSRDDLSEWEARHGRLPEGACVAMHSGWGMFAITDPERYIGRDTDGTLHFPGIANDAARWLIEERQIVGLAVDTLSLDHGPSRDFPVHRLWLPSGRWGLENVANLDQAPAVGAVLVIGLPKVKGATGAPVRLLALLPG